MSFTQEASLLLIGGAIGLVSTIVGMVLQYILDNKKYRRQLQDQISIKEKELMREKLLAPGDVVEIKEYLEELKRVRKSLDDGQLINTGEALKLMKSLLDEKKLDKE